jgi:hypothetical protein
MLKYDIKKYSKLLRNIFIVLCVYVGITSLFIYSFSNSKSDFKVDPNRLKSENRAAIYQILNDKQAQKTPAGKLITSVYRLTICGTIGEGCTDNPKDGDIHSSTSATGVISKLILVPLNNPPSSGIAWSINNLEAAGFVPKSYAAQGVGFSGLKPFAQIWNLFRNLAYLVMVLVVITIGFLIMFRRKVNPQTIVSLENSLPRIVVAFVLITFSFPIAGFLIDLMYLFTFVIISFLGTNTISPYDVVGVKGQILNGGFSLWDKVFANGNYWQVGDALLSIMPSGVNVIIRILLSYAAYLALYHAPIIGFLVSGSILNGVATIQGLPAFIIHLISVLLLLPILFFIVPTILSIIFFLTGIFVFFRIFFLLFKNYIQIILLIIFSPVILLLEAVPGQKVFSKWLKMLVANLLSFPITIGMILLSNIIVAIPSAQASGATSGTGGQLIPLWTPPLLYSSYTAPDAFSVLVGVGILFMIPNIIKSLKQLMGIKDGILSGVGLGIFFGGVSSVGGAGMGGLGKYASLSYGLGSVGRIPGLAKTPVGKKLNEIFGAQQMPH